MTTAPVLDGAVDVQFVLGYGFASGIIAFGGAGGKVGISHVDFVLRDGTGRLLGARSDVIQGIPAGVQVRPPYYEPWKRQIRVRIPCTAQQEHACYAFAWRQRKKPYDHSAIWAFALDRDFHEDNAWICSELVYVGLEEARLVQKPIIAPNKVDPTKCALAATGIPGAHTLIDREHTICAYRLGAA